MDQTGAAVIGGDNNSSGVVFLNLAMHRFGNLPRIRQGNGGDRRPAAAKESAERTSFFGGGDDVRQEWNQFFPIRLMQVIAKGATQILIIARGERGRDCGCICRIFDRSRMRNLRW